MQNLTLLQYFHWYYPTDGSLWNNLKDSVEGLSAKGITHLWLPPACKATEGANSVGYDIYDLYDVGEFDQKNSVRTKYGTRQEYEDAIKAAHENNILVVADIVLNHKAGADELEKFTVLKVNPANRNEVISDRFEIEAWTKFTFPGRKGKYSGFIWDHQCFTGIDWANDIQEDGIYSIQNQYGQGWEDGVSQENGSFDYLMYCDIEFRNGAVREEIKRWGEWYVNTFNIDAFRLDAIKHIPAYFFNEFLDHIRATCNKDMFVVGEYWEPGNVDSLTYYIEQTQGRMQLFDAPLHHNFYEASRRGKDFDMRSIFDNTIVQRMPHLAVTLVDNHDTQPLQSLEAWTDQWFRPLAYSIILLRQQGIPCVFFPDLYGASYKDYGRDGNEHEINLAVVLALDKMIVARKLLAYGTQRDYFDHKNCVGWTREGTNEKQHSGLAVILCNGEEGVKPMEMGKKFSGKTMVDITGNRQEKITVDKNGWADFRCNPGSVSVWVADEALQYFQE